MIQLDRELAIAQESQATFAKTHELFSLRFNAGRDSRLPVERAKASLDSSVAQIADLKKKLEDARNGLAQAQRRGDYAEAGRLTYGIIPELESNTTPTPKHDSSTNNLIRRYRRLKEAK